MSQVRRFPATDFTSVRVPVEDVLDSGCRALFELWDSLRAGRFAPAWKEFDLMRLPPRVIAFTRVVDVIPEPFDLVYRFWGTGLITVLGMDRTGKSVSQSPAERARHTVAEYEAVVRERAPFALVYNARSVTPGGTPIYAPAIRLPLSDDGETVTKVIAHADYDAEQDRWKRLYEARRAAGA